MRFIFAIYLLLLSFYPCNDGDTCIDDVKNGTSIAANDSHEHNSAETDSCTPFCICSCCAASVKLNYIAAITFSPSVHNTGTRTAYFDKPLLSTIKSIWQPPRIS